MPPPRSAPARAPRTAPTFNVLNVIATRPRSNVAAGLRSSGRLPRYVYGLVLSTIVKKPSTGSADAEVRTEKCGCDRSYLLIHVRTDASMNNGWPSHRLTPAAR